MHRRTTDDNRLDLRIGRSGHRPNATHHRQRRGSARTPPCTERCISSGPGALGLYRFDKRSVLRYAQIERLRASRRVFGYTNADPGPNARPNPEFHPLFVHFIGETAKFWRDNRISEVIRDNAVDPTFGSIAIVRRAGLDLRNNVKNSSYGFVNVLRIETLQALRDAFAILQAPTSGAVRRRQRVGRDRARDVAVLPTSRCGQHDEPHGRRRPGDHPVACRAARAGDGPQALRGPAVPDRRGGTRVDLDRGRDASQPADAAAAQRLRPRSAPAAPGGHVRPGVARRAARAHARSAHAHLIASELFSVLATLGHTVSAGEPGENVTTEGLDVHGLGVGSVLLLGDGALVGVTGLRNPCAQIEGFQVGLLRHVAYRSNDGAFVRRAEIMGVVLRGGADTVGDTIAVSLPPASSRPLERVWPNALHIRYRSPGTRTVRCPSSPAVSPMGQGRPATRCG